jgi:serine/threonine protein kinase
MANKKIGTYAYSENDELGRGTSARVYLAKNEQQLDEVAIKIFSADAQESFDRECEIYSYIRGLERHILRLRHHL